MIPIGFAQVVVLETEPASFLTLVSIDGRLTREHHRPPDSWSASSHEPFGSGWLPTPSDLVPPPPGPQEPFGLDDFHDSLLEKIISFMDAESVLLTSQTCKRLHRMCEREVVWEHLVCSRFGHRQNRTIVSSERHFNEEDGLRFVCIQRMSWKMVYKKHREVLFALFRGNSAGKVQSVGGEWFVNHANELALPSLA